MRDVVGKRIERTQGRISAKRLLPEAVAAGYLGRARSFRCLVAEEEEEEPGAVSITGLGARM